MVVKPWGLSDPLSVAEQLEMYVAGSVVTTGDPVALSVVKVRSAPRLVPALFVATTRK